MTTSNVLQHAAGTTARGAVEKQRDRLRDRIEQPTDEFKVQVADQIENLAGQVRTLGGQFDRTAEAHAVARRLERTADYLRFRPAGDVVADGWQAVKESRTVWIAGGLLAGYIVYRVLESTSSSHGRE